jgi:peptidoglycan/LPS O-acetylase OafA/YrhL
MSSAVIPPKTPTASNGHLPALDGLRAIAIATVFGFHLSLPGFSLGWAGVQLFSSSRAS